MIGEPGHPTGPLGDPLLKEETTMLKTISAALLAVSVLAAPAIAAGSGKVTEAPKTTQSPAAKSAQLKPNVANANAHMGRHHAKHVRHHRFHKKMSAHKTHRFSKATIKHAAPAIRRG